VKQLIAKTGERTKILQIFSDNVPQQIRFTASPVAPGEPVAGKVEIVRRHWFAKVPTETFPLRAEQAFDKRFADVDYAIFVTPSSNVRIAFKSRHFERRTLFIILSVVVALGALGALFSRVAPALLGQ
jgi:hypothetical protein